MGKISAVYQILNTVTNDRYVGSSKDVMRRWTQHKCPYSWKEQLNKPLYKDMQKYGVENFKFQILAPVMPEYLTQVEQEFIEMLKPMYNDRRSKGWDVERKKEYQKEYNQSDRGKKVYRKAGKKYLNQPCSYNGENLTLIALIMRFKRARIKHPTLEAKKYLLNK